MIRQPSVPSVSRMFGANLGKLVARCESVSAVARTLDISRAQFNRFLRGESYPKPRVLKTICDHFGVDARILTEELPDAFVRTLPEPGTARPVAARNYGLENAADFLPGGAQQYVPPSDLPDGLFLLWRNSLSRAGQALCSVLQLSTVPGARVFRTYVLRDSQLHTDELAGARREMRGIVMGADYGYAWLLLYAPLWNNVAMAFCARPAHEFSRRMNGFYAVGRSEYADLGRLSRCVIEQLEPVPGSVIRAAHAAGFYRLEDLPTGIRAELSRPLG